MKRAHLLAALALAACAGPRLYTRGSGAKLIPVHTEGLPPLEATRERVIDLADDGARRLVLTDQAAWVLRGGVAERIPGSRRWRKAVLIPAADGRGTWAVALDAEGRLWRIRPGAGLEEIADRYGLGQAPVRDLAAPGGRLVVLLLDGALAVADGRRVLRYPAPGVRAVAGGGRAVALEYDDAVDLLDLGPLLSPGPAGAPLARVSYALPHLVGAAVDNRGVLFAASRSAVYRAQGAGGLGLLYDAAGAVGWLAAAGPRVWFTDGDRVLLSDDGPPVVAQGAPPGLPVGAADGTLWLLGRQGPRRLLPDRSTAAEARWEEAVSPVFARACSGCHRPDGRAGVDLSTASAWMAARDEILERVVVRRTMPPAGHPLSEDDREAVRTWTASAGR